MTKPDLKVIDHPDKEMGRSQTVFNFGWARVTVETPDSEIDNKTTLWALECAKGVLLP